MSILGILFSRLTKKYTLGFSKEAQMLRKDQKSSETQENVHKIKIIYIR